ncbi:hypothetical protein QUC31_006049, partial [Theobroma cacao]
MMKLSSPFQGIILILFVMLGINSASAATKFNVLAFGAKPNGETDSTKAFLKAWNAACGLADSTMMYVPKGRYLLGSMAFKGDCKSPQITIRIDGTLVAPGDYRVLGKSANWLGFEGAAVFLSLVVHLMPKDLLSGLAKLPTPIVLPEPRLAKDLKEEGVQNVIVRQTISSGTQNGLRTKSWARPSNGFVQGVRFMDFMMRNVWNPIVIDQNYCPHNLNCPDQVSGIKIRDIVYKGIRGTSLTPITIKFDCSAKQPCTGIRLQNVNLTYLNKAAQSSCSNV